MSSRSSNSFSTQLATAAEDHPTAPTGPKINGSVGRPPPTADSLDRLQAALRTRLIAQGIDTTIPIAITFDSAGRPLVEGDHPQRGEIERVLREDLEFCQMCQELLAASGAARESGDRRLRLELTAMSLEAHYT